MRFAIYKPYKPILFNDEQDTSSWSRELVNLIKILTKYRHNFDILSESDLNDSKYKNDFIYCWNGIIPNIEYDVLFVSNGVFSRDIYGITEEELFKRVKAKKYVLLCTDYELAKNNHNFDKYDLILSQTKQQLGLNWKYAHLEKLFLYDEKMQENGFESRNNGVFIGHERDRIKQIEEYVLRPSIEWYGKSKTYNYNNPLTKSESIKKYMSSKFAIVITDSSRFENGFISQRYYEGCLYGCINFVHKNYDCDELCISKDDWRRFSNYNELYNKIQNLNKDKFDELQKKQFKQIEEWLDGDKIYNIIINILSD